MIFYMTLFLFQNLLIIKMSVSRKNIKIREMKINTYMSFMIFVF